MNENDLKTIFSHQTNEWETPEWLFKKLDKKYGPFTLDPAATKENKKCDKWFRNK